MAQHCMTDYEATYRAHRLDIPHQFNIGRDVVDALAEDPTRLAAFERNYAGLRMDLLHRAGWPELKDVELAIVWFETPPGDVAAEPLFEAECMPVAAPDTIGDGPIWAQVSPPLHYRDRMLWRQWLVPMVGGDRQQTGRHLGGLGAMGLCPESWWSCG
jgi:DNA-binding transcriptional LysR family regulator